MSKTYVKISILALLSCLLFLFFPQWTNTISQSYPAPSFDNKEAVSIYREFLDKHNIKYKKFSPTVMVTSVESIGLYAQEKKFSEKQIEKLAEHIPFYNVELSNAIDDPILRIDPLSKQVNGGEYFHLSVKNDHEVETFVHEIFGSSFTLLKKEKNVSDGSFLSKISKDKPTNYVFEGNFHTKNITEKVVISVTKGHITSFERYGDIVGKQENQPMKAITFILPTLVSVLFFIFFVNMMTKFLLGIKRKEIISFKQPIYYVVAAAVTGLFLNYLLEDKLSFFSTFMVLFDACFVFLVASVYYNDVKTFSINEWKHPVGLGFLFAAIASGISTIFYSIALSFGAWSAPTFDFPIYMQTHKWMILFFPLCIGVTAAICEEILYRLCLDKLFSKLPVWLVALVSSFIWALVHLGYEVFPWYLRVIELTLFIGPFLFYIYKKFSIKTSMMTHYFFNSFFSSFSLLYFDVKIGFTALLLTLFPFLVFLFKQKKTP